jgi:3-(3-hydroxy-phenyl)propionate hydroxylase
VVGAPPPSALQRMSADSCSADVIIVGLGPVGAVLANLLGGAGVRVLVLEREERPYLLPRAVHFDDETMRVFQAAGCAEEVSATLSINAGMQFVDKAGTLLLDWPRPQVITANGWYASYRFHQPDVEQRLVAALERTPHVVTLRGATVVRCVNGAEHATVHYTTEGGGGVTDVTARYVVGCDGANSTIRSIIGANKAEALGVPREVAQAAGNWENLGFQERWLVVDVRLQREMPELGVHTRQTCDPERPSTYTRQPGNRRRWELKILDTESNEEVSGDPAASPPPPPHRGGGKKALGGAGRGVFVSWAERGGHPAGGRCVQSGFGCCG